MKKLLLILCLLFVVGCSIKEVGEKTGPEIVVGPQGDSGEDGSDGNDGTNGTNGEDGTNGTDGANCYDQIGDWNQDGIIDTYDCLAFNAETNCQDIANTDHCSKDKQYAIWIDGTYYSNVNMQFKSNGERAVLCGDIIKHNSDDLYAVWVEFERVYNEPFKDHNCYTDFSTEDWEQYNLIEGTIKKHKGGTTYVIAQRGEPFQIGTDANVQERKEGIYNASGWFQITSHNNCEGDFNFNLKCL